MRIDGAVEMRSMAHYQPPCSRQRLRRTNGTAPQRASLRCVEVHHDDKGLDVVVHAPVVMRTTPRANMAPPRTMSEPPLEPPLELGPPIYLVVSEHECWKCYRITPVISLAVERVHETIADDLCVEDEDEWESGFCILSGIESIPDDVLSMMQEYCPAYRHTYSRFAGRAYFMNHCLWCDAPLGDFYMHDEPGSAFTPQTEEECRELLLELPLTKPCPISCVYSIRPDGDFVLRHARRQLYRP